mmetsp:Transcript_41704/g.163691  ORF Transcript_41704/g.163691 Transcript_41704/m.163691 type:complete len:100 (-) Transcript_41704:1209-1508(-)
MRLAGILFDIFFFFGDLLKWRTSRSAKASSEYKQVFGRAAQQAAEESCESVVDVRQKIVFRERAFLRGLQTLVLYYQGICMVYSGGLVTRLGGLGVFDD